MKISQAINFATSANRPEKISQAFNFATSVNCPKKSVKHLTLLPASTVRKNQSTIDFANSTNHPLKRHVGAQGSYAILNINFQTIPNFFRTNSSE